MKKTFTWLSLMIVFAFSCTQKPKQLNVEVIDFKDQTENLTVDISRNVMSSEDPMINESCVIFNGHVEDFVAMLHEKAKEQAFAMMVPGEEQDTIIMNYFTVREEVFLADSHHISLLVTVQTQLAEADMISESYAFNFDVKGRNMLVATDLIDFTKSGIVDEAILAHFDNPNSCFTATPTLEASTAINFNNESVNFTYDPMILGPTECGGARIVVPITEIRGAFLLRK